MALSLDRPGAYAPTSTITDLIDLYRNRSMATPFTKDVLARAGVSESLVPRVLQSLHILDLITEDGMPTEILESLRRAKEPERPELMAAWIQKTYAEILKFVEPTDSESAIRDAFRGFNPVGQQARMVSLFIGLCRAAGMRPNDMAKEPRPAARKVVPRTGNSPKRMKQSSTEGNTATFTGGLPAPLMGLLQALPREGGSWRTEERAKFLKTFESILDFCYPISTTVSSADDEIDPLT